MKKTPYITILILCVTFLAGCASGPEYPAVKKSGALTPHQGKGMVLIYRTNGFASKAYRPYIYVNQSELLGRLVRGGFYSYEANPGLLNVAYNEAEGDSTEETRSRATRNYILGSALMPGQGLVGGAFDVLTGMAKPKQADIIAHNKIGLNIQVLPGQTHYIFMGGNGGNLKATTQEEAEDEIEGCSWLNPQK